MAYALDQDCLLGMGERRQESKVPYAKLELIRTRKSREVVEGVDRGRLEAKHYSSGNGSV
jgi:hypothetical protein